MNSLEISKDKSIEADTNHQVTPEIPAKNYYKVPLCAEVECKTNE